MANENALIVYYSRTGTAQKVAEGLKDKLGCDAERVTYANKKTPPSFIRACFESVLKKTCAIEGDAGDYAKYARIIAVTPVWASGMSTPIRAFFKKHARSISSYSIISVAFSTAVIEEDCEKAAGKKPEKATLILADNVNKGEIDYDSLVVLAE